MTIEIKIKNIDSYIHFTFGCILGSIMNWCLINLYVFDSMKTINFQPIGYMAQLYAIVVALMLIVMARLAAKNNQIDNLAKGYSIALILLLLFFTFGSWFSW